MATGSDNDGPECGGRISEDRASEGPVADGLEFGDDEFRGPPSPEEAAAWRSAARAGNTDAMYNMGLLCYQQNQLVGSDSAETWWVKAAKADHTEAMMNLGLLRYEQGQVLGDDSAESWWLAAAEKGNADAACNLGAIREAQQRYRGHDSAEQWWSRAAAAGSADAAHNLVVLDETVPPPVPESSPGTVANVQLQPRKPSADREY